MKEEVSKIMKTKYRTIRDFSDDIGMPYGTLYDVLNNKINLDKVGVNVYIKMGEALGCSPESLYYLLSGKSPQSSEEPTNSSDEIECLLPSDDPSFTDLCLLWAEMDQRGRDAIIALARSLSLGEGNQHQVHKTA